VLFRSIPDYEKYFMDVGGSEFAYGWNIFRYFSENLNSFPVQSLQMVLFEFLKAKSLFLSREHFVPFIPTIAVFDIGA